jgi:hypothetical protein
MVRYVDPDHFVEKRRDFEQGVELGPTQCDGGQNHESADRDSTASPAGRADPVHVKILARRPILAHGD